ncbi:MAG: TRAP transporter large permease subunit [Verrucomicrobiota bacterium]
MSEPSATEPAPATGAAARLGHWLRQGENLITVLILGALMLLPLAEMILRKGFDKGIPGVHSIVQHCTMLIGILGGAIAARENRLLSMSALPTVLKGGWKTFAGVFSGSVAMMIAVALCVAGWLFTDSERQGGARIALEIPVWKVLIFLPIGFGLVAWRLLRHSASSWKWRIATLAIAVTLFCIGWKTPQPPQSLVIAAVVLLFLATVLGAPVFVTLGGAAVILFWGQGYDPSVGDISPIASVPLDHYRLTKDPILPTVPLFTLAGYFLAEGGASKRLVRVFHSLFGSLRGGTAIVTCIVCAFFTTFTGASGVTILALGGLLMPVLIAEKYSERNALGLLTSAGALGTLFAPCLPLILYAIIATNAGANITIKNIFLGGALPGLVLVIATAALGIWLSPQSGERATFNAREAGAAIWQAKWELLLPAVAFGGLFGGFATPVETAALTAFYAFFVETFVYRDLKLFKDVPRVITECGLLIGGVLLILGVALAFTNYLVDAQVATKALEWTQENIDSRIMFLLALNVLLLVVGCLMDVYSAIIVVVPLLVPMGEAFGIHPVHLGIIFLANLELGFLTPPVGMNLFLASYRFNKPLPEVYKSVVPMVAVRLVAVLLITYVPFLSTWLPGWLGEGP